MSVKDGISSFIYYVDLKRSSSRWELPKPQIQVAKFKSLVTFFGAIANLIFVGLCRAWNYFCGAWTDTMTGLALVSGGLCLDVYFVLERKLLALLNSEKS